MLLTERLLFSSSCPFFVLFRVIFWNLYKEWSSSVWDDRRGLLVLFVCLFASGREEKRGGGSFVVVVFFLRESLRESRRQRSKLFFLFKKAKRKETFGFRLSDKLGQATFGGTRVEHAAGELQRPRLLPCRRTTSSSRGGIGKEMSPKPTAVDVVVVLFLIVVVAYT